MKIGNFNKNDITMLIVYLGEATFYDLTRFIKEEPKVISNQLERLVGKSKIIMSTRCGEVVYTFNYSGEQIKGYSIGELEALK